MGIKRKLKLWRKSVTSRNLLNHGKIICDSLVWSFSLTELTYTVTINATCYKRIAGIFQVNRKPRSAGSSSS